MSTSPLSPTDLDRNRFLARKSFIELTARERANSLFDPGTARELLGPFDRLSSPWLAAQGILVQADDVVVITRSSMGGRPVVVIAIEGGFQGGSIGEVSGSKIWTALNLARQTGENGVPIPAVLIFETGGVRLQEANLGLAFIGEIQAEIVSLRRLVPVVGVIPGMIGCFGGMAMAAALCSHLIMTREGRLSLSGPEVIEQEAGIDEFDSHDRRLIWSVAGGVQRCATGFADELVEDDVDAIVTSIKAALGRGIPQQHRSERVDEFLERLSSIKDPTTLDSAAIRILLAKRSGHER